MISLTRRQFIKFASIGVVGLVDRRPRGPLAWTPPQGPVAEAYSGPNLADWEVVVGDGCWPLNQVDARDIKTVNYADRSELQANIQHRNVAAHNITVKRVKRADIFDYVHVGGYKFRLTSVPSKADRAINAQTIEGGIFLWDGRYTRLACGIGFSWMLNPWGTAESQFGDMRMWTKANGGQWATAGSLTPDTEWHEIRMVLNDALETTLVTIDGVVYPSYYADTPKPANWTRRNVAMLQAEIVSIWPDSPKMKAIHTAEFKDWYWNWQPPQSSQSEAQRSEGLRQP